MKRSGPIRRKKPLRNKKPLKPGKGLSSGAGPKRKKRIRPKPKSPEKFAAQYGSTEYVKYLKSRPCDRCGVRGYSSSAHTKGAGTGMKAGPETLVSLCEDRPDVEGCHTLLDRYKIEDERPALQALAAQLYRQWTATNEETK